MSCIISFIKKLEPKDTYGDYGIIHQLVHLIDIPEEPLIDVKEIRKQFDVLMKMDESKINERDYANIKSIANHVTDKLGSLKNEVIGKNLSTIELLEIINTKLSSYDIKFDISDEDVAAIDDYNEVGISHGYAESNGIVTVCVLDDFYKKFDDDEYWNMFLKVVKTIFIHEITHIDQIDKSGGKFKMVDTESNSSYLSNIHEIEAHANQSIEQYLSIDYTKSDISNLLKNPDTNNTPSPQESSAFWKYYDMFSGKYGDPVIWKKFLKYCYQYLESVDVSESVDIMKQHKLDKEDIIAFTSLIGGGVYYGTNISYNHLFKSGLACKNGDMYYLDNTVENPQDVLSLAEHLQDVGELFDLSIYAQIRRLQIFNENLPSYNDFKRLNR